MGRSKRRKQRKEGRQLGPEKGGKELGGGVGTRRGRMFQLLICNHFNSLSSTVKRVRKMKGGRLNKNLNASITG